MPPKSKDRITSAIDNITDAEVEEYLKENMAKEIAWIDRINKKKIIKKNVAVIPQGIYALVITKTEVLMVNWVDILLITYSRTEGNVAEKNIRYMVLGTKYADKNANMFKVKPEVVGHDDMDGFR